jgi:hypothetical protein
MIVRVTVEHVFTLDEDCDFLVSWNKDCDFYTKVTIDGKSFQSSTIDNDNNISPSDWVFSHEVPLSTGSVPVTIELWDSDDNDDDHYDFTRGESPPSSDLDLNVNLAPCSIDSNSYIRPAGTGYDQDSFTGACDVSLVADGWSPRTGVTFKIEVSEPPYGPDLGLRCLHTPLWPQPGQTVTIKAEALDGNTALKQADNIEIYVDTKNAPQVSTKTSSHTVTHTPSSTEQFFYGCRVKDNGLSVFTGWRVVQIGQPATGRAVPIIYTGPSSNRLDIVFIPDKDDYTGAQDPQFVNAVTTAIRDGYYGGDSSIRNAGRLFLENQDAFNFWIALDSADTDGSCDIEPPANWGSEYTFANAGALFHSAYPRDCGEVGRRIFSTNPNTQPPLNPNRTLLHETGHIPFGLADEYCCDGGYAYVTPHPNVWFSEASCLNNDPLANAAPDACQQITHPITGNVVAGKYRVDPASTYFDDLMTSRGGITPRPADERRINWLFEQCRSAGCKKNF